MTRILGIGVAVLASLALSIASWRHWIPVEPSEAFGFITGALCVWLAVKEHLWNWPIGIVSSVFFVFLFWHKHFYGDMGIQVVYIVLGAVGWYWWLWGGQNRTQLPVSRTPAPTAFVLAILTVAATIGMTHYFRSVPDSAPFWDALTTALSLAAQYMLTKKLIESWYVWIFTDIIYIGMYHYKHLDLTAGLNVIFVVMCVFGLRDWRLSLLRAHQIAETAPVEVAHG